MTRSDLAALADLSAEDLASRAQGGDQACFDELARRLRAPLTAFLTRRLPSAADADDVVQETLLRAYRHLDRYDPSRRFSTWLFAIGKNVASNHRASQRRRADLERRGSAEAAITAVPAAPAAVSGPSDEIWRTAERVLGAEAYRALWLRYADEMSVRDVARLLGRTVVSTKVMLFRARKKLLQEEI
jgi:RNA polymerase sigma-70 factor (ECF subfamily)